MRVLRVIVPDAYESTAATALDEHKFAHVAIELRSQDESLFEVPMPSNAVGDVLDLLEEADVPIKRYTVVSSGETSITETSEQLAQEYAGDYEPLTGVELRSKARDLSRDAGSYSALMILSAIIAAAGLLLNSPAIVVGSMVIAPIIGPALTASVGAVTHDRSMVADSLWMQLYGLGFAIVAAATIAAIFRFTGVVPDRIDLPALDLIAVRLAPNALSLIVGVAAGLAAGIGLTTKGPTSIIGVMIAAALLPTAAATGIAIAWVQPSIAIGSAILLLVTMIAINLAILTVLAGLRYHHRERAVVEGTLGWSNVTIGLLIVTVLLLSAVVIGASVDQVYTDREIQQSVDAVLEDYDDIAVVSVQSQYRDISPFTGPREVHITVSIEAGTDVSPFADDLHAEIEDRTGETITVRVDSISFTVAGR